MVELSELQKALKAKMLEILLDTIENSPFRQMECQIESGVKNARRNWKKKMISDEDFKRICTTMYVPINDIKGTILNFGTFEKDYQGELERFRVADREKYDLIQKYEQLLQDKVVVDRKQISDLCKFPRLNGFAYDKDVTRTRLEEYVESLIEWASDAEELLLGFEADKETRQK